jgi:FKBP-type peptidyl-prolyl cis-trans isomerase (trigger factor)
MADAGGREEEEEEEEEEDLAFNNGDDLSIDMEGMMEGEEVADFMVRILGEHDGRR